MRASLRHPQAQVMPEGPESRQSIEEVLDELVAPLGIPAVANIQTGAVVRGGDDGDASCSSPLRILPSARVVDPGTPGAAQPPKAGEHEPRNAVAESLGGRDTVGAWATRRRSRPS